MTPDYLIAIEKRLEQGIIKSQDVTNLINEVRSLQSKLTDRVAEIETISQPIRDGIEDTMERSGKLKKGKTTNHQEVEPPETSN